MPITPPSELGGYCELPLERSGWFPTCPEARFTVTHAAYDQSATSWATQWWARSGELDQQTVSLAVKKPKRIALDRRGVLTEEITRRSAPRPSEETNRLQERPATSRRAREQS